MTDEGPLGVPGTVTVSAAPTVKGKVAEYDGDCTEVWVAQRAITLIR